MGIDRPTDDLPLFAWQPPVKILLFPMACRVGRVRDVASKLLAKSTDHHAIYYREQVNAAVRKNLSSLGLNEDQQDEQLHDFWEKVHAEAIRMNFQGSNGRNPRGAA